MGNSFAFGRNPEVRRRKAGETFSGGLFMKYVSQFLRILVFCWLGEVLHALLPVPVPASIYGLALLLGALKENELPRFQEEILRIDGKAFIIYSESTTIVGNGFRVFK